jgi:hypothetical protein
MNPLLQQTSDQMLAKVDKRLVPVINKVVESGKKVMYDPQTSEMAMTELSNAGNDPEAIGAAIAKLGGVLFAESQKTLPPSALFPALIILMCEALDFLEENGVVQVTPDFLAAVTQELGSAFLQMMGVSPEKLQSMVPEQGQGPSQPEAAGGLIDAGGA